MLQLPRPATGHNGHSDRFADAEGYFKIESSSGAIGIDAVQDDLARAQFHSFLRPLDRVQASRFASAVREHFPCLSTHSSRINTHHDALAAELFRALVNQLRICQSG